jgi:uncharacterized protein (DUF1800 family)
MGARPGEAAALTGYFEDWIQAQFSKPYTPIDHELMVQRGFVNNADGRNIVGRVCTFARWVNEDAQLRFRVAHVLQQIVVCGPHAWSGQLDSGLWWNALMQRAFSTYRDILMLAVTHRHMGWYLNNRSNDGAGGRSPSVNFSRELLQLFSMGVVKLNRNGSVVRDSRGNPVQSYDAGDVSALAKLLVGWSVPAGTNIAGRDGTALDGSMSIVPTMAYDGPAVTFLGTVFPQVATPTAATVLSRVNACLDLIMAQQTTAVYISKQFIQKLVTDSPTPEYIARVVSAFENNGGGVRGDLKAVVSAVLLDSDARGNSKPATFGRAQEWILSLTKAMRYGEMETLLDPGPSTQAFAWVWSTDYGNPIPDIVGSLGQAPMTPTNVFNDYPFEYQINGVEAPAASMWRAPQILANVSRAMSYTPNLTDPLASTRNDPFGRWALSWLIARYDSVFRSTNGSAQQKQTAAVTTCADLVFADLNQGRSMTNATRGGVIAFIDIDCAALSTREKLGWMINFIRCIPESAVVI